MARITEYPVWAKYNGEVSKVLVTEKSNVRHCWRKFSADTRAKQSARFNGRTLAYEEEVIYLNATEDNPMEFLKVSCH